MSFGSAVAVSGDDVLVGGDGSDILTGGTGADIFDFDAIDPDATDTIMDFDNAVEGDVLDLKDVIDLNDGSLADLMQVTSDGTDTTVVIHEPPGGVTDPSQTIFLVGVDLTAGGTVDAQDLIDTNVIEVTPEVII